MSHTKERYKMQPDTPTPDSGGWDLPEVAEAQRELVERELALDPASVAPYRAFLRAMEVIPEEYRSELMDLGCGVGHYATLLRLAFPRTRYIGVDNSRAMIEAAALREPRASFRLQEIMDTSLTGIRLVLHSVAAEVGPNALSNVCYILDMAPGYIIWNRIRIAPESGYVLEPTYSGHVGKIWLWSRVDLLGLLALASRNLWIQNWPERADNLTVILGPRNP